MNSRNVELSTVDAEPHLDRHLRYVGPLAIRAKDVRRPGRWIIAALVGGITLILGISLYNNPNIDHPTIGKYLFSEAILDGLVITIELTVISSVVAIIIGTMLAVFKLSNNPVLKTISGLYIWGFRAVPLLVQILIWGNLGLLFKRLEFGIPFTDITWISINTNAVFTGFVASIVGLGLHESAYMAEIIRGGIISVNKGQREAAESVGLRSRTIMARIILPQAIRIIIPPMGNQIIGLMKASSLVSVIAGGDLLTKATNISAANYRVLEMLLVATFWYCVLVTIMSVSQYFVEQRLARKQVL